jgi:RNA polymerase sigma-70 factor (ECF subfamily)
MNEENIIKQVKQGNIKEYEKIMDIHMHRIRTFIALNAPVAQLVDEISVDAFVFAFQHISEFKEGTSFSAWVKAIAWNLLRAEITRYKRKKEYQKRYAEFKIIESVETKSESYRENELGYLEDCIEQVPQKQREILNMKYKQDHSAAAIADAFEKTESWVHTSLFRIRETLRKCIESKLSAETL